jgi:hypothetical protein
MLKILKENLKPLLAFSVLIFALGLLINNQNERVEKLTTADTESTLSFATVGNCAPVTITWEANPEPNIVGYNFYLSEDPDDIGAVGSEFASVPATEGDPPTKVLEPEVILEDLEIETTYYAAVTAYNNLGIESFLSDIIDFECDFVPTTYGIPFFTNIPEDNPFPNDTVSDGTTRTSRSGDIFNIMLIIKKTCLYTLEESSDLKNWEIVYQFRAPAGANTDDLQMVIIPKNIIGTRGFFRVTSDCDWDE